MTTFTLQGVLGALFLMFVAAPPFPFARTPQDMLSCKMRQELIFSEVMKFFEERLQFLGSLLRENSKLIHLVEEYTIFKSVNTSNEAISSW